MNNTIIFLFSILNIFAELTELSYDLGASTRKYVVPALIATYVVGEMVWDKLTSIEFDLKIYNTPLTTGFAL